MGPTLRHVLYELQREQRPPMIGKTMEVREENVREDLCDLGMWRNLNPTTKAQTIRDKLVALPC